MTAAGPGARARVAIGFQAAAVAAMAMSAMAAAAAVADLPGAMPRYAHILIIIDENKGFSQILGPHSRAPNLRRLAAHYGLATDFHGEVHPSEGNYVALLGGDTFGIHDDDAFFCNASRQDPECPNRQEPGYADHSLSARSLVDQLEAQGLSWKAYLEGLPAPGSLAVRWPPTDSAPTGVPPGLYASKHNAFLNFERVRQDPRRLARIVDFRQLYRDLATGRLPTYAHIVPSLCDDMHGLAPGAATPADCRWSNRAGLIARGDRVIGELVRRIMAGPAWSARANMAVVITFDEDDLAGGGGSEQGCCGSDPQSSANFGGGHIPTLVITNHGPRAVVDATPYNHYSLLRTCEVAFGIDEFLGHAADAAAGARPMTPLFTVRR